MVEHVKRLHGLGVLIIFQCVAIYIPLDTKISNMRCGVLIFKSYSYLSVPNKHRWTSKMYLVLETLAFVCLTSSLGK